MNVSGLDTLEDVNRMYSSRKVDYPKVPVFVAKLINIEEFMKPSI